MEVPMGGLFSWLFGEHSKDNVAEVNNPATVFEKPSDVVNDSKLSNEEKRKALDAWEQDARQLMTASNEGMPGREEGLDPIDHHRMAEVVRAKETIGEKPKPKPAH
jgi:hypothetical protein